jgi:hypothetical protein
MTETRYARYDGTARCTLKDAISPWEKAGLASLLLSARRPKMVIFKVIFCHREITRLDLTSD